MARQSRGNMLVLSGIFVTVLALALIIASSFGSLYFVHNRLQTTADELALAGARKLNEQDRIGQMNNMIARSRQLVFDANESVDTANLSLHHLSGLADRLHTESREGAALLESERQKLHIISQNEAFQTVLNRFNGLKEGHALVLPWLQVSIPVTPAVYFGCTDKVKSNVPVLEGVEELKSEDQSHNYLSTDGSQLYKDNIDARLPGSDGDLHFFISSLPAPVLTDIAPARAILARSYKDAADGQLTSTVRVELQLDVATGLGAHSESKMKAIGTAVATGGQPML